LNSQTLNSGKLVLVFGGVRSGKSRFAQELAIELGGDDVLFVATAEARDDEMTRRIEMHRQSRPASWLTLEQPLNVGGAIATTELFRPVILLDCLTLLVSNVVLQDHVDAVSAEQEIRAEISSILNLIASKGATLIIVSGEVGMGLVPETSLGRLFRDLLGWSNQLLAAHATSTYFMLAGLPLNTKLLSSTVKQAAMALAGSATHGEPK
jgi:adenosylcobinamide kinase/adenosylcobinamide-phosphate guanylyltransferase